jgi:outer membrane receptor protein involved in Fe transport
VLVTGLGWAQESTLQGVVTDQSKAVIPGVEISLTNVDTKATRKVVTNDSGFYSVPLLKEGNYRVQCSLSGFQTTQSDVRLDVGQVVRMDFQLQLGNITDVVEIMSTSARIQQQPHSVGTVIEEKQIQELPLDGRNYLTLAGLAPGILRGGQGGRGEQTSGEGGFRSGGLPFDHTAILVDGVDNAARTVQGPLITQAQTLKPAVEAVSEFKVVTNNISAEYGYKAGAQVQVSTKGGTNEFHGSLYEFHRNAAVSANNFMFNRDAPRDPQTGELTSKPPYIRNQFGGTFGGPIVKDKTFFFFSFQGTRLREGGSSFLRAVPSPLAREGNFSQEIGTPFRSRLVYDPLTLTGTGATAQRDPFPGSIIPQTRIDPVAKRVLDLYPLPNLPGLEFQQFNYFFVQTTSSDGEEYDFRVDHNFSSNHRVYGRYSHRNDDQLAGTLLPYPARASNFARFRGHQLAFNYNATLGPRKHNEFRYGYTHFPASRTDEHTENLNAKFGIKNAAVEQFPDLVSDEFKNGLAFFNFTQNTFDILGGGSAGGTNTTTLDTTYYADNFQIDLGRHNLKFGGEFRTWRSDRTQAAVGTHGQFVFDNRFTSQFPNNAASRSTTGHAIADAMLGWTSSTFNGLPVGEDIANPYWGIYIQNDWRVTNRLTINAGLRWELFMQPRAQDLSVSNNVAKPVFIGNLGDETSATLPIRFSHWEFPKDEGDCGCQLDKKNWAPRLGIAYRVTDKTVLRVGAGLYYSENGTAQLESTRFQPGGPRVTSLSTTSTFETTEVKVQDGFPLFQITDGNPNVFASNAAIIIPDFKPTTNSAQWFLDIQHQLPADMLLTLGYNGQKQSHMPWWQRNVAAPLEPGITAASERRRTPLPAEANTVLRLNSVLLNENMLSANYNAFTAKLEKRFAAGLSFTSSFTWSKALDYGISSINERGEGIVGGAQPQSPHVKYLSRNYGASGLSRDFAYSLSTLYEVPAGPGKGHFQTGLASWILGGWQLGGILILQSGPWVSTLFAPDFQNAGGTYRGNLVGDLNLPESERDSMRWFNRQAIVAGPQGEFGNAGRGLLEAPGYKSLDFLVSRNFPMPFEGHRLQFRFEAFNFTNTPHLASPSNNTNNNLTQVDVNNPASVRILAADEPRIIQFALKYTF